MGTSQSTHFERELDTDKIGSGERFFGLVNFGNTCYCNSVLQALYFCKPFRERILDYKQKKGSKDNLLACLSDLFLSISNQKRRVGTVAPKRFIAKLKKDNELFDNFMQQDAHEFFNYLLNAISGALVDEARRERAILGTTGRGTARSKGKPDDASAREAGDEDRACNRVAEKTWVEEIFQGCITNETRCLNCEHTSHKSETFLDLSVDVESNISITHALKNYSDTETLSGEQKYYCENCCSKQEAQKRMRLKDMPRILVLHLKRFKYVDHISRFTKLSCRVMFSHELRVISAFDDDEAQKLYDLVAVVVHCGSTPNRGHYITLVKSDNVWVLFDDDLVDKIEHYNLEDFFGLSDGYAQKNSESAYILFYEQRS